MKEVEKYCTFATMNTIFFIARRLLRGNGNHFSGPVTKIAAWSIALGVAVMLISMAVLQGFQTGIKEKIVGFGSHIQVLPFNDEHDSYSSPLSLGDSSEQHLITAITGVKHVQPFAVKAGIIKTDNEFQGVMLKGYGKDFDTSFLSRNLVSGRMPILDASNGLKNEVLISENLSNLLGLRLKDKLRMYFYSDETYRGRVFSIVGIYNTGLGMYDNKMVFCAIPHIQKLNHWSSDEISGMEVLLHQLNDVQAIANQIYRIIRQDETVLTIQNMEPSLFSWLELLDSNVTMILILMALVSVITMISTLLILIFERTTTIGILKSFGTPSNKIIKIFLYQACIIIIQGLFIGNAIAGLFYFIQSRWHPLKLDAQNYFLDAVPLQISVSQVLFVNLTVLLLCYATLLLPAHYIDKIRPIKALKFE